MNAAAACFSGRTAAQAPMRRHGGAPGSRRAPRAEPARSSLEEDFKKQCLGRTNGSSSNPERLKDLSASRFGAAGDLAAGGGAAAPPPASDAAPGPAAAAPGPAPSSSSNFEETLPFAANLPLGEPYHPLEFYPTSQQFGDFDWGASAADLKPWLPGADRARCFVLLFGVGRAETEGIYSLRAVAKDDGLPVDTIVAFENEDDALRYSTLLEATMDHQPTVCPIEWGELLEFCNSAGYRCRLEPAGSLLIPPDYNVRMTDWEKSLRLRKGEFSVLGAEPAPPTLPDGLFLDGPSWVFEPAAALDEDEVVAERFNAVLDSQLSSPLALEAMRASLERLLPQD